jgi:hypothetical protein
VCGPVPFSRKNRDHPLNLLNREFFFTAIRDQYEKALEGGHRVFDYEHKFLREE